MVKPKILALVGMCGSGKSSAAKYLRKLGFSGVYFGQATFNYLNKKKLPINSKNETIAREELRDKLGPAAFAFLSLPEILSLTSRGNQGLIYLDGLYSFEEYEFLVQKKLNLIIVEIFVDKKLRYSRLAKRKIRPLNKKEGEIRDLLEIKNLNKSILLAISDYKICNNYSKQNLADNLKKLVNKLNHNS